MLKPLHLLVLSFCTLFSYGQKTDTLVLFYKPDEFHITRSDKQKLDSFLVRGWDRISINGYTDETDSEEYNLVLSQKRSGAVLDHFISKKVPANFVSSQYFGESMPRAANSSDDGRALNRRTEIIGYQFAKVRLMPREDPMKPVTQTLDNGFIITYRPGSMSASMAANFEAGSGMNFQLISNTVQMRQNNLYNNTTNGEILSSVLIICGSQLNPCKLDSPILIKVPIPVRTNCPIEKVKFFNTVVENGKRVWQEQTKLLYPEEINGVKYIRLWIDNFCECINFDFKIDPECFDTDSTQLMFVNADIKNLSAELRGLNSVYLPKKIDNSSHRIIFLKDKLKEATITFALYKGKRRVRGFRDQQLTTFPYDEASKKYILSTGTVQLYFPRLQVDNVVLKVNGDKYWISPEENKYEFTYLNRQTENILVDFSIISARGKVTQYKNQPLESFPVDENTGYRVIDKKFLKALKQMGNVARM